MFRRHSLHLVAGVLVVTNGVFSVDRQDEVWNGFEYAAAYCNQVSVNSWTGNVLIFR